MRRDPEPCSKAELFGYEKGAFTGANAQKKGRLEMADGGVVFLDEIGELAPPAGQTPARSAGTRVQAIMGGTRPIRVDIRLIAATNRNLQKPFAAASSARISISA